MQVTTMDESKAPVAAESPGVFDRIRGMFSRAHREKRLQERLDKLRHRLPVPLFWLFGKTQTGKTSIIKFLTGADQAEIGKGFQPCTRFSRQYQFPTPEAPLVSFLDTRGLDEPTYDPAEDLARFNSEAHVLIVTVKVLDHAQEHILGHLQTLRKAQPSRPVVLVLTCLHEAYPQQQHPQPYPFIADGDPIATEPPLPEGLVRSIAEQRRRFDALFDKVVVVDLTQPQEGFAEPNYGGPQLRDVLLDQLPSALGQTLRTLDVATRELQDLYAQQAMPHILGYSLMAATAGAVPIPFVDLILLSSIQTRMVYHLAELYGQPMTGKRFIEIAASLGLGMLVRQAGRELLKLVPFVGPVVGSVAAGALAGASTFALGKAFCYYYRVVHQGHIPKTEDLRKYYKEQLSIAEKAWSQMVVDTATKKEVST
jgi:uncharacterized protein (DUF697 family)